MTGWKTPTDEEIAAEIRGYINTYGLHSEWTIAGKACCAPHEIDAAIAYEVGRRRKGSTGMIVTTGGGACAPGVFLPTP